MFSMHGRGDLVQFLESEGFEVSENELTDDIKAAAIMHAQTLAMSRSQLFRSVMINSERVLRKVSFEQASKTMEQDCNEDFPYEDENIFVRHRPESWGMTTVHIKKKKDYRENIDDWDDIFEDRNTVVGYFQKEPDAFLLEDIRDDVE